MTLDEFAALCASTKLMSEEELAAVSADIRAQLDGLEARDAALKQTQAEIQALIALIEAAAPRSGDGGEG